MAGFPTRGEAQRRSGFRFLLNYATKNMSWGVREIPENPASSRLAGFFVSSGIQFRLLTPKGKREHQGSVCRVLVDKPVRPWSRWLSFHMLI